MHTYRCNAKFLWKRIPQNITSSNPEIAAIWTVGQKLWKKDLPGTYHSLAAFNWTEPVVSIIRALEGKIIIDKCTFTHSILINKHNLGYMQFTWRNFSSPV